MDALLSGIIAGLIILTTGIYNFRTGKTRLALLLILVGSITSFISVFGELAQQQADNQPLVLLGEAPAAEVEQVDLDFGDEQRFTLGRRDRLLLTYDGEIGETVTFRVQSYGDMAVTVGIVHGDSRRVAQKFSGGYDDRTQLCGIIQESERITFVVDVGLYEDDTSINIELDFRSGQTCAESSMDATAPDFPLTLGPPPSE